MARSYQQRVKDEANLLRGVILNMPISEGPDELMEFIRRRSQLSWKNDSLLKDATTYLISNKRKFPCYLAWAPMLERAMKQHRTSGAGNESG